MDKSRAHERMSNPFISIIIIINPARADLHHAEIRRDLAVVQIVQFLEGRQLPRHLRIRRETNTLGVLPQKREKRPTTGHHRFIYILKTFWHAMATS